MRAIHRKLLRDLLRMKGQVAAIGVVVAAGVMSLIVSLTTLDALTLTKDRFYQEYHYADVFADLTRAPNYLEGRLREIRGVDQLETRVFAPARLEVPYFEDPVRGHIISIPDGRQPAVNRLYIREGRLPAPDRAEEVAVSEAFADAHGLRAGDRLRVIIRGSLEDVTITGLVLSPEFVYQVAPTDLMPDYKRYAVLWMNRRALSRAFAMEGGFNNVALTLQRGTRPEAVIEELDRMLAPYGGIGAHDRDDQFSHRFLSEELQQVRAMTAVMPTIFLAVSAFLLHVLMGRIVRTQREQVAVLKAFGYDNRHLAVHYGSLTALIVLLGSGVGILLGAWAADWMARLYLEYFHFPELSFRLQPSVMLLALAVAGGAAFFGAFASVRSAVKLPPAEAMRPAPPERYSEGWVEHSPLIRSLGQSTRIIIRSMSRHPLKTTLSVLGISLSGALLVIGAFQFHAVDHMIDVQYRLVQKMDVHLTFTDPTPERALHELPHQPGVLYAEGYRSVPVRLIHGVREYQTSILGLDRDARLRGLIDRDYRPVPLLPEGLMMTRYLADYLGVSVGESVRVEIMEGHRRTLMLPLAGVVDEPLGVSAYMERRALNRIMREGPALTGAWLLTDRTRDRELFDRLRDMPRIAGIGLLGDAERSFREHVETMLGFFMIMFLLAISIAFAVVYNNARITLSERTRELATLRVLGFTQAEVSWILVGEIMILALLAIPLGWGIGTLFAYILNQALTVDIYRVPFVVSRWTYAFAAAGVFGASAITTLLMTRRLRRLDMVAALKAVE